MNKIIQFYDFWLKDNDDLEIYSKQGDYKTVMSDVDSIEWDLFEKKLTLGFKKTKNKYRIKYSKDFEFTDVLLTLCTAYDRIKHYNELLSIKDNPILIDKYLKENQPISEYA